jgi:hypothetical protein
MAYGSAAMSHAIVYRWYAHFQDGREDMKDDARSVHPSIARTDENVESVRLLTEDSSTTLLMIADRFSPSCNRRLGKKKDLREICSSCLDRRAETRTRCLLPGSSFNGTK